MVLLLLILLDLSSGSSSIDFFDALEQWLKNGTGFYTSTEGKILSLRLSSVICALAAGIALSISGMLLQTIFFNPLAGPSVIGIIPGASLGVVVFSVFGLSGDYPFLLKVGSGAMAMLFSFFSILILMLLQRFSYNKLILLIYGVLIGYFISALSSILLLYGEARGIQNYVFWGMGSFNKLGLTESITFLAMVGVPLFWIYKKSHFLDLLSLGDSTSIVLGFNPKKLRFWAIVMAAYLVGITTSNCGPIAFVGLAVPLFARFVFHSDGHQSLFVLCCILGGVLTVMAHALISVFSGFNMPINAILSIMGAPVVFYMMIKRKNFI